MYNNKIKTVCSKDELNSYLAYLDEQLYIYPKLANLPEAIREKIKENI